MAHYDGFREAGENRFAAEPQKVVAEPKQHPDYPVPSTEAFNPKKFVTRDSGERQQYAGGMQRDSGVGKLRPDLVKDGPMYLRWVQLMTRGAVKYEPHNWMKATGREEYDRFLESADRHFTIWYFWRKYGINIEDDSDSTTKPLTEDHAAAVMFNLNGVEFCGERQFVEPLS